MRTENYVCDACTHAFAHFQSMASATLRTCPQCRKRKLRRLIGSGAGVIFKGGGFYETDYKRKGNGGRKNDAGESGGGKSDARQKSGSQDAPKGECTSEPASCSGPCSTGGAD